MMTKTAILKTEDPAAEQADTAFCFPQGMAGFQHATRFGFIYQGRGDIVCIQSLDHPEAAFLMTPWDEERLGKTPSLSPDQATCLDMQPDDEILWLVVLNPFADRQWVTANLKAPVALNMRSRRGLQCIRPQAELEIRYRWMPQPQAAA